MTRCVTPVVIYQAKQLSFTDGPAVSLSHGFFAHKADASDWLRQMRRLYRKSYVTKTCWNYPVKEALRFFRDEHHWTVESHQVDGLIETSTGIERV